MLLPLVNAPLIEYTLEWLAMNRVEEVLVFCCAHADQVKRHLAESKWLKQRAPRVTTIVARNCLSAGEALRALDQRDLIKGDFILVSGDTVANVDLAPALAAHRARREKDKNAIMTLVMRQASDPHQRLRLGDAPLVVALDPACNRLLRYIDYAPGSGGSSSRPRSGGSGGGGSVKVDAALFGERDGVALRSDLIDCHIAICAPEVLMLFSDNFDYQHLKRDFVCGVLSEEELGNKVHVHVTRREYAARVHNLRAYDAVSRDLLQRWAFPFVPDTNVTARGGEWGPSSYRYARGGRYLEASVSVARGADVGPSVAVGAGTSIGDGSVVAHSVIGRGCRIGRGCVVRGAYLMDGVTLGDGCSVAHALLCDRVTLRPGARVQPGAVLSFGVVVGPKHAVPGGARVSLCRALAAGSGDSDDDELEYAGAAAARRRSGGGDGGAPGGRRQQQQGRRRSGRGASSSDGSGSDWDESSDGSGGGGADAEGRSLETPAPGALRAAEALARGQPPPPDAAHAPFDREMVGEGGAGYAWPLGADAVGRFAALSSIAPPAVAADGEALLADAGDDDEDGAAAGAGVSGGGGGGGGAGGGGQKGSGGSFIAAKKGGKKAGSDSDGDDSSDDDSGSSSDGSGSGGGRRGGGDRGGGGGSSALRDPEAVFCREVAETYLRCVQLRFDQTNAVIELNGLKIAEDRTFADCARYIMTAMLDLCAPAAPHVASEYRPLFPADAPDAATAAGKLALLKRFRALLGEWGPLLRRFLRSEDDQVELLLTLEEYCAQEGVFEALRGAAGPLFAAVFPQLLQQLYERDVVDEAAFGAWASEKEHADASERVYLDKARPFLEWLQNASEDEDEDDDEEESSD